MDLRAIALTVMTLALVILSLTFGPSWPMAFLILFGVILGGVDIGKQEEREEQQKQEEQTLLDSAPARDAPAHALDHVIDVLADAPVDALADAPADVVDVRADGLAPSVDAPTPVVDAPASLADAPALSVDAPVDALADAPAISVDAPVDAPALSVDAPVDAPALSVDAASVLSPAVVATGIKMRRKQKLEVKLNLRDDRERSKAMQAVFDFGGIFSMTMDSKDGILMVTGDFDVAKVVKKLRKSWPTEIVSLGPAKEDDGKKDEGK